jgi:glycosyltransferase involved in cell wall biosynthesis
LSPHAALESGEVEETRRLERAVVLAADLVIACTDEELTELRAMADDGNAHRRFVVARNAIAPFSATSEQIDAVKRKYGLDRYPLFVGSAHPPNADGFWSMLAPSLAFLRPGERIVVAGGVGHILRQHRLYAAWSGINEPRLAVVGEVDRAELDALLLGAAVILLPITTGGGSNLKTAEAIFSGRPALATPHALRGYGDAARWPTISVADTPDAYRCTLRTLLDRNDEGAHASGDNTAVTWAKTLDPLSTAMATFSRG